jgi:hypothetical protein
MTPAERLERSVELLDLLDQEIAQRLGADPPRPVPPLLLAQRDEVAAEVLAMRGREGAA